MGSVSMIGNDLALDSGVEPAVKKGRAFLWGGPAHPEIG